MPAGIEAAAVCPHQANRRMADWEDDDWVPEREAQQQSQRGRGGGDGGSATHMRAVSQHQHQPRSNFSTLSEPLHRLSGSAANPEPTYCQVSCHSCGGQGMRQGPSCPPLFLLVQYIAIHHTFVVHLGKPAGPEHGFGLFAFPAMRFSCSACEDVVHVRRGGGGGYGMLAALACCNPFSILLVGVKPQRL